MDKQDIATVVSATTALLWAKYGREIAKDITKATASKLGVLAKLAGKRASKTVWDKFNWHKAALNYNKRLQQLYGTTTVLGNANPIPLENIFTDVYILDKPSAFQRFNIEQLTHDPTILEKSHHRIDGISLVKQKGADRLFILGKPGAGKTTFLKHLVWQATQGDISKTPIFISLKEWADSKKDLIPFISKQFDICGFPEAEPFVLKLLDKGGAIVLFDGLDEVKQEDQQRWNTIAQLRDFTNKYDKTQCLITCRIAATSYSFDKFHYVELADFTNEQIHIYVEKWFKDQPLKLAQFFKEFNKPENKNLRELARTPILLGLLCLAFDSTMAFPSRRVEIYEEAIEALLKKWDSSREILRDEIYRGLSIGRKRQMFARIAAKTFQANQYFLPENKVTDEIITFLVKLPDSVPMEDIDGVAVLKSIEAQHGIFCERANQIYSFAHLTFQEYFSAKYIVEDTSGRALRGLMTPEVIADPRWREVIILAASLLNDAGEYMRQLSQAIDDLIATDGDTCGLLNHIYAKSLRVNPSSSVRIRAFYFSLAFNLIYRDISYLSEKTTLDLNLIHSRLIGNVDLAREMENDNYAQTIYHAQASMYDLMATLDLSLARTIDHSLPGPRQSISRIRGINLAGSTTKIPISKALDQEVNELIHRAQSISTDFKSAEDREMQIDLHLTNVLSHLLCYSWWPSTDRKITEYIQAIKTQAIDIGLTELGSRLAQLDIPSPQSKRWKQFVDSFREVIDEERMIGRIWIPTGDQCLRLVNYFNASLLLLNALEVAAVSNRTKIKENLLTTPKQKTK